MKENKGLYRWHSGAPDDRSFTLAHAEVIDRINERFDSAGLSPLILEEIPPETHAPSGVTSEYVAEAFGDELVDLGAERDDLVVIDADLSADCRLRSFEEKYPDRFIENGIAEQDMVSMAGGLALQGLLPVVNTFAAFLASRANEQIYTNACERTKIVHVCHYAGLIPAGPGQSHQSCRDISLFGSMPDVEILQPCNAVETRQALRYCVNGADKSTALRLIIGPSPRRIDLPSDYRLTFGRGSILAEGKDALLFSYGPVMLSEAMTSHEILDGRSFGLTVINMPWLNRVDRTWLEMTVEPYRTIYVLEDHSPIGGLGDHLHTVMEESGLMIARRLKTFGVEGYAACGTPQQVLKHHGLDGLSLSEKIFNG